MSEKKKASRGRKETREKKKALYEKKSLCGKKTQRFLLPVRKVFIPRVEHLKKALRGFSPRRWEVRGESPSGGGDEFYNEGVHLA